ncbi:hypothetical protein [Shouchella patagoniensis]|uniref:hypothetical protein n=1 Tax=Shouchella patagoniensis TaxID=228576 RepID=UPI000995AF5A|nr:hypothetical protein [Shouchella patagoniensis]
MQKQQIWLPLLASAGIGVAAYYSMTKGQGISKTAQQFVPLVAGMGAQGQQGQQNDQQQNGQLMSAIQQQ